MYTLLSKLFRKRLHDSIPSNDNIKLNVIKARCKWEVHHYVHPTMFVKTVRISAILHFMQKARWVYKIKGGRFCRLITERLYNSEIVKAFNSFRDMILNIWTIVQILKSADSVLNEEDSTKLFTLFQKKLLKKLPLFELRNVEISQLNIKLLQHSCN